MNMACEACQFLGGLGACPPGNFLKIRCCKIEFGSNFSHNCILLCMQQIDIIFQISILLIFNIACPSEVLNEHSGSGY